MNINTDWDFLIDDLCKNSGSIAYGVFNSKGEILNANDGMLYFLGTNNIKLKPQNKLVNPSFEQIKGFKSVSDLLFSGKLTIGNQRDIHYVLNSKIYKKNNNYLIFAEADVIHLFDENGKMSRLNQEINNLQRQLIKEKRTLQQTLNTLRETQQMLVHSEKMNALGQMIAGIAHEINNPIAYVTNNLHELEKNTLEYIKAYHFLESEINQSELEGLKESAKNIRKEYEIEFLTSDISEIINDSKTGVERVKNIVEDLRKFSRLDEADLKNIDLVENIRSIITIIKTEISNKNILFNFETPDHLFLDCYPGQLNQAVLNVLINAVQAVDEYGKVILYIAQVDDTINIIIKDNGKGMNEETRNKMFDPFFTTKPVGTGTGLGMSITYKIIRDLHKGKIEVESAINSGTTISIIIPKKISK